MNKIQCSIKQSNKERRNRFKLFFSNFVITYVYTWLDNGIQFRKRKKLHSSLKNIRRFEIEKILNIYTTIISRDKYLYNYSYY